MPVRPQPLLAALCLPIVAIAAIAVGPAHVSVRKSRLAMGTLYEIQIDGADDVEADRAANAALDEVVRVDRLLSNYLDNSDLTAMNRAASHRPVHVSDELFGFLEACAVFYRESQHTFDPAVGSLVRAWGFMSPRPSAPPTKTLAAARRASGFDHVVLDPQGRTVRFTVDGLEIDPGGIGKGYAVDRAVGVLKGFGIRSALVSAGGSTVFALGHPDGRGAWRVAVSNPTDPYRSLAEVPLRDAALSTSGVALRSVASPGGRLAHIFDPRIGQPVRGMCQATVVSPSALDSDALTKPAFILSRDEISAVARARSGVHVLRLEGECEPDARLWTTPWSTKVFVGDRVTTKDAKDTEETRSLRVLRVLRGWF